MERSKCDYIKRLVTFTAVILFINKVSGLHLLCFIKQPNLPECFAHSPIKSSAVGAFLMHTVVQQLLTDHVQGVNQSQLGLGIFCSLLCFLEKN